ncbi:MAG: hypothetical protein A2931_00540 [Candidatus Niyogibacteria bacterium RIFCSPLOWO2_01_FULL_45_48]|uniref:Uncharacterized protein n=2 Tax=Candidatus Niyogiibacteriota TaxID=1817912 RepID=A0A1G2F0J4_9BACT|nr:MAG: hypothetical protein A2931_00540 [Candidatus Niyogibacteria bacterium RIFCSPLOWO2_01_FULL_45_48]OGZ31614.1 MAG: hypothetical protein A3J00_00155 [Candidatus Niyogibacteria bacterium RIFCSPLOWO2_02_FULL_45_13]
MTFYSFIYIIIDENRFLSTNPNRRNRMVEILLEHITAGVILFKPSFEEILLVKNNSYGGKQSGWGFTQGRTTIRDLVTKLRDDQKKGRTRLIYQGSGLKKELANLGNLDGDSMRIWLGLSEEMRNAMLLDKAGVEAHDESGIKKEEIEVLERFRFVRKYPLRNDDGKVVRDVFGRVKIDKEVDTVYFLCFTCAEGVPRKSYRKEISGSGWFKIPDLPPDMYKSHREFLMSQNFWNRVGYWKEKYAPIAKARQEPDYEAIFKGMGREE